MTYTWYESVPSGLRWFCDDCDAFAVGVSELDSDEEIDAKIVHKTDCRADRPPPTERR